MSEQAEKSESETVEEAYRRGFRDGHFGHREMETVVRMIRGTQ